MRTSTCKQVPLYFIDSLRLLRKFESAENQVIIELISLVMDCEFNLMTITLRNEYSSLLSLYIYNTFEF